jgi:hypothetical protein
MFDENLVIKIFIDMAQEWRQHLTAQSDGDQRAEQNESPNSEKSGEMVNIK